MRASVLAGILACAVLFLVSPETASATTQQNILKTSETSSVELAVVTSGQSKIIEVVDAILIEDSERTQTTNEDEEIEVKKHIVASNESMIEIAKQYSVDWRRIFDKNTEVENPDLISEGQELIIPRADEELEQRSLPEPAVVPVQRQSVAGAVSTQQPSSPAPSRVASTASSAGNRYVAGYCTWYVKNRRPDLPNNLGNASSWVSRAAAQGIATGNTPKVGAVAQRNNHVAYVESVNADGTITISDMNYRRLHETTVRTVNPAEWRYIY